MEDKVKSQLYEMFVEVSGKRKYIPNTKDMTDRIYKDVPQKIREDYKQVLDDFSEALFKVQEQIFTHLSQ